MIQLKAQPTRRKQKRRYL